MILCMNDIVCKHRSLPLVGFSAPARGHRHIGDGGSVTVLPQMHDP